MFLSLDALLYNERAERNRRQDARFWIEKLYLCKYHFLYLRQLCHAFFRTLADHRGTLLIGRKFLFDPGRAYF